jgi:hypothetical protein
MPKAADDAESILYPAGDAAGPHPAIEALEPSKAFLFNIPPPNK